MMNNEELSVIGAMIVAGSLAAKGLEAMVRNMLPEKSVLIPSQEEHLKSLYDWHAATDAQGRKLWYSNSHEQIDAIREQTEVMNQNSVAQAVIGAQLGQLIDVIKDCNKSQMDMSKTTIRRIEELSKELNK